jgi:hypothetical protein
MNRLDLKDLLDRAAKALEAPERLTKEDRELLIKVLRHAAAKLT